MSYGLLNKGVESMGAAHRSYDKAGLRMWVSTVKENMSKKIQSISVGTKAGEPSCVGGDTKRSKVY